ncbi:Urease accessory protein UreF [Oceanibacterium hippocampi]|uniref:Urease accessory protein UreF n=2 Tax=Oceanibacterium hippocampi TaxID=745714 RepID=A0A1Y5THE4_9PROT|nr:Urease accessory protein UreF [Oceanibacterium hippocampi]
MATGTNIITATGTIMDTGTELTAPQALRLASWLSPSFPIGAFSYSHGLEFAIEHGDVTDETTLLDWLDGLLSFGSGRNEAILFAAAWRAAPDAAAFRAVAEVGAALRPSVELALETEMQGAAFLDTVIAAWPDTALAALREDLEAADIALSLPVVAGAACRLHGLPLAGAMTLHLHAFAANLVSAGVRLIPLGQTAGQRITAALEAGLLAAAAVALDRNLDDLGGAGVAAELCSLSHETQYTRLFRS